MSWADKFCKELPKEDQQLCRQLTSDFWELLSDLEKKDYLLSFSSLDTNRHFKASNVFENLREVTDAFNRFNEMYMDKERSKKFVELNKPHVWHTNFNYLLYSLSVIVFLQNIEAYKAFLLYMMKLPIRYEVEGKTKTQKIHKKTTLGNLLKGIKELGIKNPI